MATLSKDPRSRKGAPLTAVDVDGGPLPLNKDGMDRTVPQAITKSTVSGTASPRR